MMLLRDDIDASLEQLNEMIGRLTPYRGRNGYISETVTILRDARMVLEAAQEAEG